MKVREFIKKYLYKKNIKIGAKNGSAFIYAHACNQLIYNYIEKAENEQKVYLQKHLKQEGFKDKLKNYVSILDREVLESYDSIFEPNTIIVLFEGEEKGKYWMLSEFKLKKYEKEKEDNDK